MNASRTRLLVYGLSGGLLFLALVAFLTADRGAVRAADDPGSVDVAAALLEVDAIAVRREATRGGAELRAALSPVRQVTLAAEVEGRVIAVEAQEHRPVAAAAVLVRLDPTLAEAAVQRAEAAVLRTRATHKLTRLELARQRDLSSRQVTSAADLDRAESEERSAFAAAAEAAAQLADARARLDKTVITAPFPGVVNWLDLEVGAFLRPGDRVAELLDISAIELEVGVTDRQVVALREGDRVTVEVDVYPAERFEGAITRVGRAVDQRTQQYPVEIQVPNPGERLLPGMLGRARLWVGDARPAIHVPRRAARREFDLYHLYVLERDGAEGTVAQRRVATRAVPFRPELLEVTDGLEVGEWVAVSNVRELRNGQRVRLREQELQLAAPEPGGG